MEMKLVGDIKFLEELSDALQPDISLGLVAE